MSVCGTDRLHADAYFAAATLWWDDNKMESSPLQEFRARLRGARDYANNRKHQADERRYWREDNKWSFNQSLAAWTNVSVGLLAFGAAITVAVIAAGAYMTGVQALEEAHKQTVEALRLAKAAEDQIAVAKDSEERQLRAYVAVNALVAGEKYPKTIQATVQNGGQTPAYAVNFHLNWQPVPVYEDLSPGFDFPDQGDAAPGSLAILNGAGSKEVPFTFDVGSAAFLKVIERANDLIFYGHIDYDDIFGMGWRTETCWRYSAKRDEGDHVTHTFSLCRQHNQAKER
jgi:hypothetical protein